MYHKDEPRFYSKKKQNPKGTELKCKLQNMEKIKSDILKFEHFWHFCHIVYILHVRLHMDCL